MASDEVKFSDVMTPDGRLTGPFVPRGPTPYIDPLRQYYSARGDGAKDDTAALQAALYDARDTRNGQSAGNGATVLLPGGTFRITRKLIIPAAADTHQRGISLRGSGMYVTRINAEVAGDAAIESQGQKQGDNGKFTLNNALGARGATVGIRFIGETSGGTQTGSAIWRMLGATNFAHGLEVGLDSPDMAASEIRFEKVYLNTNDVGALIANQNTLNITFHDPELNANGYGILCGTANSVHVFGGHAANNTIADFYCQESGVYSIHGFRSEGANRFVRTIGSVSVAPIHLSLVACNVTRSRNVDDVLIDLKGVAALHIAGCMIRGKITVDIAGTYGGGVGLYQSGIGDSVPVRGARGGSLGQFKYDTKGCWSINKDTGYFEAAMPDDFGMGKPGGGVMSLAGLFEKAGAISDADFSTPPPNGTQGNDTLNLRRYTRIAGTWRYAAQT